MANGPSKLANVSKKLMSALNSRGHRFLFANKQFIGNEGIQRTLFVISEAVWEEDKHKWMNKEIYSTTSMVRIVLFLRDLWYLEIGKPLPTDQEIWNTVRADLMEKGVLRKWAVQDTDFSEEE